MAQVSMHRALSSAMKGETGDAGSDNPHQQAIAKVNLGQTQGADNSYKPTAKPVDLGKTQTKTDMTIVGDESKGFAGLATSK